MLDFIRTNAQSVGVKLAFGIIIAVFVFWGVGSMQNLGTSTVVATVNGEPISVVDFEMALRQAQENLRRENPAITPEQMQQMQLPRQILDQLIIAALLQQEAENLHLVASPLEMRRAIAQMPIFHNEEGVFDPAIYKSIMSSPQANIKMFENSIREQLLEGKLRRDVTITGGTLGSEARAFFDFTYESRDVEYIFFPAADTLATLPAPAEDAVKSYYETNRAAFTLPAKADVSYVMLRPTDLVKPESIATEAVQAYYDKNKGQFTEPAKAKTRHILLRLEPDADEATVKAVQERMDAIVAEQKTGASFAELATKYSEDTATAANGGDLDWVVPNTMVEPFNTTVFAMKAGDVSAPIRTDFGLHLIQVDETQAENVRDLNDVDTEIRLALAEEAGLEGMNAVLDSLVEANVLGNDMGAIATKHGLQVQQSGLKSADELQALLSISSQNALKIINTSAGMPLDTALDAVPNAQMNTNNAYLVVRVTAKEEPTVRPYDAVKLEIVTILTEQDALKAANAAATSARKEFTNDANDANVAPENLAARVERLEKIQRSAPMGALGNEPELSDALFTAEKGQWLPVAYNVMIDNKGGAVLARTVDIHPSDKAQWQPMEQIINNVLAMQKQEQMFNLFLRTLMENARVEIVNEAYLNSSF